VPLNWYAASAALTASTAETIGGVVLPAGGAVGLAQPDVRSRISTTCKACDPLSL